MWKLKLRSSRPLQSPARYSSEQADWRTRFGRRSRSSSVPHTTTEPLPTPPETNAASAAAASGLPRAAAGVPTQSRARVHPKMASPCRLSGYCWSGCARRPGVEGVQPLTIINRKARANDIPLEYSANLIWAQEGAECRRRRSNSVARSLMRPFESFARPSPSVRQYCFG